MRCAPAVSDSSPPRASPSPWPRRSAALRQRPRPVRRGATRGVGARRETSASSSRWPCSPPWSRRRPPPRRLAPDGSTRCGAAPWRPPSPGRHRARAAGPGCGAPAWSRPAAIGSWWALVAIAALLLALVGAFLKMRLRVLGAVVGALVAQAVLRLPAEAFHGFPSLVALVAVAPLLGSAYERSAVAVRRRIRIGLTWAGGLVIVAGLAFGVSALLAQHDLTNAVGKARDGLDLIRNGKQTEAAGQLDAAADDFGRARKLFGRLLDLAGPTGAGGRPASRRTGRRRRPPAADIARSGAVAANTAPYQQLKASNGRVDLRTVREHAAARWPRRPARSRSAAAHVAGGPLSLARRRSPIRCPTSTRQVDRRPTPGRPRPRRPDRCARHAGRQRGPHLPRSCSPTRPRAGSSAGSPARTACSPRTRARSASRSASGSARCSPGRAAANAARSPGSPEFLERYARYDPAHNLQNLTVSPDLPTDATVTRSLYQQYYGSSLDGVVVVDPYGLAALLQAHRTGARSTGWPSRSPPTTPPTTSCTSST